MKLSKTTKRNFDIFIGVVDGTPRKQLAELSGVTYERIRQIYGKVIRMLRRFYLPSELSKPEADQLLKNISYEDYLEALDKQSEDRINRQKQSWKLKSKMEDHQKASWKAKNV